MFAVQASGVLEHRKTCIRFRKHSLRLMLFSADSAHRECL
jgi:hypothetical protein